MTSSSCSGGLDHDGARLLGGRDHGVANPVRAARRKGPCNGARCRVGRVDVNVVHRDTERLGRDLAGDGLHALAEIDRRQRHDELPDRVRMDQRLARIAAKVHPDRIVDAGEAASLVLGHALPVLVGGTVGFAPFSPCGEGGLRPALLSAADSRVISPPPQAGNGGREAVRRGPRRFSGRRCGRRALRRRGPGRSRGALTRHGLLAGAPLRRCETRQRVGGMSVQGRAAMAGSGE